jgi:hypothetical protein
MGYEAAALQALIALKTLFGFVIVDDSLHTLLLYRNIAQFIDKVQKNYDTYF